MLVLARLGVCGKDTYHSRTAYMRFNVDKAILSLGRNKLRFVIAGATNLRSRPSGRLMLVRIVKRCVIYPDLTFAP
jgi:hypothetical protein